MEQGMMLRLFLVLITNLVGVRGHGRLIEPPSRSSMWRYGFKTEPNFNDNELFCGGFTVQWKINKGKCGVCGDPWQMPQPRDNEAGGKYGKGVIVRNYTRGQVIPVTVQLTANHKGYFEFKICPTNDPLKIETQECFDRYPLQAQESSGYKYTLPDGQSRNFSVRLKLPKGLVCEQCVLQWTYTSGNNWGPCPNGSSATGCGPQETFRGCADVRILRSKTEPEDNNEIVSGSGSNELTSFNNRPDDDSKKGKILNVVETIQSSTTFSDIALTNDTPTGKGSQKDSSNRNVPPHYELCKGTGRWKSVPGIDNWCVINCAMGYCPPSHCKC